MDTPLPARSFTRHTPLAEGAPLTVACAASLPALAAAASIREALGEGRARLLTDPAPALLAEVNGPVLLIGNLADNACVRALYHRHLLFTDLTYPGPGGYELRTLLNPFATGHNVLHLGHSDADGLARGLAALLSRLQPSGIPFLSDIRPTAFPYDPPQGAYFLQAPIDPSQQGAYYTAPVEPKGAAAYFTGDEAARRAYNDAWRGFLLHHTDDEDLHLRLKHRVLIWRMLETCGLLDDDLYGPTADFFRRWVEGPEGLSMIEFDNYQTDGYPRQNHGLLPALGIRILADFYARHYPQLAGPDAWIPIADNVFSAYRRGSWKPICDGLCHGWAMSQPAMFEYALLFDDAYIASGGLRRAAECAVAVTNNTGWMPESGDSSLFWDANGTLLALAAHAYEDGRYLFARNLSPAWRQGNIDWAVYLPRSFDRGIAPVLPADHIGITRIPMDPLVYGAAQALPQRAAGPWGAFTVAPAIPLDACFDKIAFRSGFGPDDTYLLLDGLGGGSHSYDDALSIVDYQALGVDWLIAADGLRASEAEHHTMVTVSRGGVSEAIPSFGGVDTLREAEGGAFLSLWLDGVAGCRWERRVYVLAGMGLAVQDTVTAHRPGQYAITARWRTPGQATLSGGVLTATRQDAQGRTRHGRFVCEASRPCARSAIERPLADPAIFDQPAPDRAAFSSLRRDTFFKARYNLPDGVACLTSLEQSVHCALAAGESVLLTTLVCASEQPQDAALFHGADGALHARVGLRTFPLPFAAHAFAGAPEPVAAVPADIRTLAAFDAPVKSVCALPDGAFAFGLANGAIHRQVDGGMRLLAQLEGCIHALCADAGRLYAGHGKNGLACLDAATGSLCWQRPIQRAPTLYPWWELATPAAMRLALLAYRGKTCLGAACGDDSVKYFDADGSLLASVYFPIGVPDWLQPLDTPEGMRTLAAARSLGCRSNVRLLDDQGEPVLEFGDEGWISFVTALHPCAVRGAPAIAMGVNHRNNLKLYAMQGTEARLLLSACVVGAVTALCWLPEEGLLLGGTSEGYAVAYGLDGLQRWSLYTGSAVLHMQPQGAAVAVFGSDGHVLRLRTDGHALQALSLGFEGYAVQAAQGRTLLLHGDCVSEWPAHPAKR